MDVVCKYCNHSVSSHDAYGCGKWLAEWEMGSICPCDMTKRQLLELTPAPDYQALTNPTSKGLNMTIAYPDTERGLYGKYRVEKINGKPVGQCFVLEERDPHAVAALRAYAESCIGEFPRLATDLEDMADRWEDDQLGEASAV